MTDQKKLEAALLRERGWFLWGYDAWIHEADEGTVLTTAEALDLLAIPKEEGS